MDNKFERYQRQIIMNDFGMQAQQKLSEAKVLVIGAGGLGCPALLYLAAAGLGTIGIADDDAVSISNLQRQVLFSENDIGKLKCMVAVEKLRQQNSGITVISHPLKITNQNVLTIIDEYDIIVDGTDNFASKYMLNDACVLKNKPFVHGAVNQFEGQLAVFNSIDENGVKLNYRDLFPKPPAEEILNCDQAGVLGVLPGIVGVMQANEVIKMITGVGKTLKNKLLIYNALTTETYTIQLTKSIENSDTPLSEAAFLNMDYDFYCEAKSGFIEEINRTDFNKMLEEKQALFIDVREKNELPNVDFANTNISLSEFEESIKNINDDHVVLFCQSGKRSLQAAQMVLNTFGTSKKIYSLRGGLSAYYGK